MSSLRTLSIRLGVLLMVCSALVSCSSDGEIEATAEPTSEAPDPTPDRAEPPADAGEVEPRQFIPSGPVGSREAYDDLVSELDAGLPAELRSQVPWPDLRNPDPIAAQLDIFEMWLWMAANHPEPELVALLTAEDSPSRTDVTAIFGALDRANHLQSREQQPYRAFDHQAVTFESAGLPLWLSRDVPDGAVVLYYKDDAGPLTIRDRDTGEVIETERAIPVRQWISIVVPTDVGWQLYRDVLIEPNDSELEVPDRFPPPSADAERPQVQT